MTTARKATKDVRLLSSGTLSYLFDETNYDRLEALRQKFISWVDNCDRDFDTWVKAWEAYFLETFARHLNTGTVPTLSAKARAAVKAALESGTICIGLSGQWIVRGAKS